MQCCIVFIILLGHSAVASVSITSTSEQKFGLTKPITVKQEVDEGYTYYEPKLYYNIDQGRKKIENPRKHPNYASFFQNWYIGHFSTKLRAAAYTTRDKSLSQPRDTCLATPPCFVYGPKCESNTGVVGSFGIQISYTVGLPPSKYYRNKNEQQFCCKGRGYDGIPFFEIEIWYDLGCWSTESDIFGTVPWGSVAGTPAVKCYGCPLPQSVAWTWSASS